MQQIRTPAMDESIRFKMFDLIATIFCHDAVSEGLLMLYTRD